MMPEFEKLKRYDLCNRLDEGLLQSEMVEKDDGEYVKADDAKKHSLCTRTTVKK